MSLDPRTIGRVLQEQRRASSTTQADIAERLQISRSGVAAIEAGHRRIPPELAVLLADAYRMDVSDLVRPRQPLPRLAAQFRLPPEAMLDPEDLAAASTRLESLVARYLELEAITESPLVTLPVPSYEGYPSSPDVAERVAIAERTRLGLGDGPVVRLRDLLEQQVGARSFSLALPGRVAGLFGLAPEAGACIGLNAAHPWARQRWTLAHEYAHLLFHLGQSEVALVDGYQRKPERERMADDFAAAFLMPRTGVERRLREMLSRRTGVTIADLLGLAHEFGVSPQALVLRLEDLSFIPGGSWEAMSAERLDRVHATDALGLERRAPDAAVFPRRYVLLAIDAYVRGLVTERDAARYLETDRLTIRTAIADLGDAPPDRGLSLPLDGSLGLELSGRG